MAIRLFLQKNDTSKNEKIPYFNLKVVPPEGSDPDVEWLTVGAFWKSKSGNGYTGVFNEGVRIDTVNMKKFEKKAKKEVVEEEEEVPLPPED